MKTYMLYIDYMQNSQSSHWDVTKGHASHGNAGEAMP